MRPLSGHQDFVLCVAFSPEGQWLASGGADNRILLWDLINGTRTEVPYQSRSWPACLAFSAGGRWLAIGEHHGRFVLYDRQNNAVEDGPTLSPGTISGLAFTPDGNRMAWCDHAGGIGLWTFGQNPRLLWREAREQFALVISPDGRYLAAGGLNGHVLVWEPDRSEQPHRLACAPNEECRALMFDPRGQTLIAGLSSGLMAWDLQAGQTLWYANHPAVVSGVGLSGDGRVIASGAWDGQVRLYARDPYDAAPPRLARELDFGQPRIHDLALSSDGMVGAVAGLLPDPLILWDID